MWTYKNKVVRGHEDLLPGCTDIVYLIIFRGGFKYIGKKTVAAMRKRPPLKGKKRARRVFTKLPFKNYRGSMEEADHLEIEEKEILYQCKTKKAATYLEAALLFHHDAIFDPAYLNKNISGTFFEGSLDGLLE